MASLISYGPLSRADTYKVLDYALPHLEITSARMFGGYTEPNRAKMFFPKYAKRAFIEPDKWERALESAFWRWVLSRQSGVSYHPPVDLPTEPDHLLAFLKKETSIPLFDGPLKENSVFHLYLSMNGQNRVNLSIRFRQEGASGSGNTSYERDFSTGIPKAWNFGSGTSQERRRDVFINGIVADSGFTGLQQKLV